MTSLAPLIHRFTACHAPFPENMTGWRPPTCDHHIPRSCAGPKPENFPWLQPWPDVISLEVEFAAKRRSYYGRISLKSEKYWTKTAVVLALWDGCVLASLWPFNSFNCEAQTSDLSRIFISTDGQCFRHFLMGFSMQLISYAVCVCVICPHLPLSQGDSCRDTLCPSWRSWSRSGSPPHLCPANQWHESNECCDPRHSTGKMENHPEGPQQILQKSTKARDSKWLKCT